MIQVIASTDDPGRVSKKLSKTFGSDHIGRMLIEGSNWSFMFENTFSEVESAQDVISGVQGVELVEEFAVPEDITLPDVPKIYGLALGESVFKHFHNIDYRVELTQPIFRKDYFEQPGLLTKIEWYCDVELTQLLLTVERTYVNSDLVGLTAKRTVRTWTNNDGTPNPYVKDLGVVPYSPSSARAATKRRRENVIDSLERDVIQLLTAGGDPAAISAGVSLAQDFLVELSPDIDAFYKSGSEAHIVQRLNDPAVEASYPFLSGEISPGVTVKMYIISQLSY